MHFSSFFSLIIGQIYVIVVWVFLNFFYEKKRWAFVKSSESSIAIRAMPLCELASIVFAKGVKSMYTYENWNIFIWFLSVP